MGLCVSLAITIYSIQSANPGGFLVPYDSDGNQCGIANQNKTTGLIARDFTEYKYKYFTRVLQSATGSKELKYNAVCVKKCPVGIANPLSTDYNKVEELDCHINTRETRCPKPTYNSTLIFTYCVPELSSTIETLKNVGTAMSGGEDELSALIIDIQTKYHIFIYMILISFITTVTYVFLLRWTAKPLLYLSLVLVTLGLLGGGVFFLYMYLSFEQNPYNPTANANDKLGIAIALFVVLLIVVIFLCCFRKAIVLGAAIL